MAVAVVRLMRIEEGGAFADVLSGEGDSSWADEMAYVGRTLGFRVPDLELRGRRLVRETQNTSIDIFCFDIKLIQCEQVPLSHA